jgi:hydrogenase maturation factor
VREERITMSHGAGGKATQTLIEAIFLDTFRNPLPRRAGHRSRPGVRHRPAHTLVAGLLDAVPVRAEVRGAAELLGIDPMYVACEGRLVAVVPAEDADRAVAALRGHPLGGQAAVIGHVTSEQPGIVQLKTAFGGTRIVDLLVGDPLPRIC